MTSAKGCSHFSFCPCLLSVLDLAKLKEGKWEGSGICCLSPLCLWLRMLQQRSPDLPLPTYGGRWNFRTCQSKSKKSIGLAKKSVTFFSHKIKDTFFIFINNFIDLDILSMSAISCYWLLVGRGQVLLNIFQCIRQPLNLFTPVLATYPANSCVPTYMQLSGHFVIAPPCSVCTHFHLFCRDLLVILIFLSIA